MRRTISCTFASLLGAIALMIVPASSFAGGGFVPCTTSPCSLSTQAMVTVSLDEGASRAINAPLLPRHAVAASRLERKDFLHLYSITSGICTTVLESSEEKSVIGGAKFQTGWVTQLAQFDAARQPLNKLLQKYGLGYAPSIEDFSEVTGVAFSLHPSHKVPRDGLEPAGEIDVALAPACTFTLA